MVQVPILAALRNFFNIEFGTFMRFSPKRKAVKGAGGDIVSIWIFGNKVVKGILHRGRQDYQAASQEGTSG